MQHDSSGHNASDDRCGTEMDMHVAPGMHNDGLSACQPVRSCNRTGGVQRTPFRIEPHSRQPRTT